MKINQNTPDTPKKKTLFYPVLCMLCLVLSGICFEAEAAPDTFRDSVPELIPHPSPTIEQNPTLQWYSLPGSVAQYFIQIGTDSALTSPLIYVSTADTQYTVIIDLPIDTIYWRVKADSSAWSKTSFFIITDARIPELIAFDDPTFERQPTLLWHLPPVPVTEYTIQISVDSLFSSTEIDTPVTDTFYVCQTDLPIEQIYWRVKSDSSEFSDFDSFLIKDNRIPQLISFASPVTLETQPVLMWHKVPGAITYTIQIDNNSDFSSTLMSMPISDTTFTPFEALTVGSIYWRVKSNLVDTWSDVDLFIIQPDTIPFLIRYDGDISTATKPEFTWYSVKDADSYKIKLADNANFTDDITESLDDTSYTPSELTHGTWYWKVSCSKNLDLYSPVDSVVIDTITTFIKNDNSSHQHRVRFHTLPGCVKIELSGLNSNNFNLQVYNLSGKCIKSLNFISGNKEVYWDYTDIRGNPVSSGMYVLVIKTREKWYSHKVFFNKN